MTARNEALPPEVTVEQLDAVLRHLPALEDPEVDFGYLVPPVRGDNGVITIGYFVESEQVSSLRSDLEGQGIIFPFRWSEWLDEAKHLYTEPSALQKADLLSLRKLLFLHIRKERFCQGHWVNMLKEGHIAAILRRIQVLRDEMASGHAAMTR
jgi:hypothetical protein